ncbi:ArnT family glycosyltransferase [Acetobacter sp.]|jgi:4-amino-4-deoxy-L-arabinose transferase-like glycosyltransferase|uniref:ArnT family glycosyltransferase n=1 Tax=Acetobacter sp. TaxID=440 RepID=UPI0025B919C0|nr:glycosyltransferase family 39 protein [Acetobacter sp.]MCH4090501.1 glycosyltransferase family 39 protein [Acetobacter sp.]MCI1299195.1 glycosyltransferase family 39 protein [Acetobacter sp.]MCI1315742.1 glycosyltransferase family 39 protein [Acetobacter sp.]
MLKSKLDDVFFKRLLLLAFSVFLLLLPGRASIPPFDRDEPRYMQATAQMLETHNFIDVRFQDKPRYLQPAGIYWLEAAAVSLTGTLSDRAVWAYRLPSLVAMTSAIGLTAWMGAILFSPAAGLLAGALLATSVLVQAEGRMATIDSTLLLAVLLAEFSLLLVLQDRSKGRTTPVATALLYWSALGCGLMLKGPVVLIPGLGTPLCFALVEKNWTWLHRLRFGWGWMVMLAIVVPWCLAIGLVSHGEFFQHSVGRNFLGKIGQGQEAHGAPPGFHLLVFGLAFWPGSFFAAASLPFVWVRRKSWQIQYLLCWIIPHWIVFELIATKLPHYVLPTYPAIALFTGAALCNSGAEWQWPQKKWGKAALFVYGGICLIAGFALSFAGIVISKIIEGSIPAEAWLIAIGSVPLLAQTARAVVSARMRQAAFYAMGSAVLIYVGLFLGVIPRLHQIWLSPRLTEAVNQHLPCTDPEIVSSSFSEPSFVFLMHGQIRFDTSKNAAIMLERNKSCGLALVGRRDEKAFYEELAAKSVNVIEYERIKGFNYSTGKWLDIGIYGVSR